MHEKITKRFMSPAQGGGGPDMDAVRAARANLRYHLRYIGYLISRPQLAGRRPADLRRSRGGGASVLHRLSGRRAVGRERNRQGLVRADEVAAVVPPAPGRAAAGDDAERRLRRSRLLAALRAKARALGFEVCRVAAADRARSRRASALPPGSPKARTATWPGWPSLRAAGRPAALMRRAKSIVMLGLNYGPDSDPLAALKRPDAGAISVYARHRDYHDVLKGKLKQLAAFLAVAARPEQADAKVFVDTAPLMEKPLAARRARLAGQAHQSRVARFRLVAVPRRDPHRPRTAARPAGERTIAANAAPASTPVRRRRFPRPTSSTRGAASPISRSSTKGRSRASFDPRSAIASTVATIVSPYAPGTNSRRPGGRRNSTRAERSRRSAPRRTCRASTTRRSAALFAGGPIKRVGQGPLPAQRVDRDRKLKRSGSRRRRNRTARRQAPLVRGAAIWALARLSSASRVRVSCGDPPANRARGDRYRGVARRARRAARTSKVDSAASVRRRGLGLMFEPLDLVFELKFLALELVYFDVV